MANEFWAFIIAVFHYWQSILTGGTIAIIIMIYERKKNKTLAWSAMLAVMGIALFISCFLAWKDQHVSAESRAREISGLSVAQQKDDAQILFLQELLASKDRPVILQNTPSPEIGELLKRQAQELSKLKSEVLSPKKKALQLSSDILSFYGEQWLNEPKYFPVKAMTAEDGQRQADQYTKLYEIWLHETVATYEVRVGARVSSTLDDMRSNGIDTKGIEICASPVANGFLIQLCGARIGGLAERLPN